MPIATPDVYNEMLDRAKERGFAYPAINVTSSETLNAAIRGYAEAGSDGIVQVSTGGAAFLSGQRLKDMVTGAVALAEFAHVVAARHPVNIALHTDHCPKDKLDGYMRPLIKLSQERVAAGQEPLFQSHMWDGSAVPMDENLQIADELLAECAKARIVMEMEIGVVGGEEDDVVGEMSDKLYSTPEDALRTAETLASAAATCWPPPSATSTASTSRATSSSAPSSSTSCSGPSARRRARTSPSTWSSTAGRGRCWPRSASRSPTASSR
jgi:fructose-bisphosphate aldolase class II